MLEISLKFYVIRKTNLRFAQNKHSYCTEIKIRIVSKGYLGQIMSKHSKISHRWLECEGKLKIGHEDLG